MAVVSDLRSSVGAGGGAQQGSGRPAADRWLAGGGGTRTVAQAPVQVLVVPVSLANRYRVRPWELTRIWPRPVVVIPIVAGCPAGVVGGVGEALALPPPLPQAATARTISGAAAALASRVRGLMRFMIFLS